MYSDRLWEAAGRFLDNHRIDDINIMRRFEQRSDVGTDGDRHDLPNGAA